MAPLESQRTLCTYADCVVSRRHEAAKQAVLALYGSGAQSSGLRSVVASYEDRCLSTNEELRMRAQPELMSGALAGALVRRNYPDAEILMKSEGTPSPSKAADLSPIEAFQRCLVFADPKASVGLTQSRLGTVGENAAVAELKPMLGTCLTTGSTLEINRMFLRNAIGVALYRELHLRDDRTDASPAANSAKLARLSIPGSQ